VSIVVKITNFIHKPSWFMCKLYWDWYHDRKCKE